ncbi:Stf0 family sulfotransferase [Paenibacillus lignilyticus]|nr:Stf0 family sulfotransferase [Paenibacillus lignilyticus]
MKPTQSYTIFFSQRTGSTLLAKALESTGVAGVPREWMHVNDPDTTGLQEIEQKLKEGTTPNGIFGIKDSICFPQFDKWMTCFRKAYDLADDVPRPAVWESAFPNCKYIYMTRRNKVRLAVSWWRAIVSDEWHRGQGQKPSDVDISNEYNFDAINHLVAESVLREAAMEEFFVEGGITPMTIVYEDFIRNYEGTVLDILTYLGIATEGVVVAPPHFDPIADDIAEQWVQRFREERQNGWTNRAW